MTQLSLIDQLNTHGHIPLSFQAPYEKFEAAHDAMKASIDELGDNIKNFGWKLDEKRRGSRVGYKVAEREDGKTDNKIFFHDHPDGRVLFKQYLKNRHLPHTWDFLRAMEDLSNDAQQAAVMYLDTLEQQFPGIKEEFLPQGQQLKGYLRMLQYQSNPDNDNLATGHNDIGFLTLQLYESGPGLWIEPRDAEKPIPVKKHEGVALAFRGYQLHKLLQHMGFDNYDQMLPDFHGVTDIPEENTTGTRRSSVFFFDHPTLFFPNDYHDTHGKLTSVQK